MIPIKLLLAADELERLATRSNFRYGQQTVKHAEIILVDSNTFNLVAEVKSPNGESETIELRSTTKGFRWKCTCTARKSLFCRHGVAVGLFVHAGEELE